MLKADASSTSVAQSDVDESHCDREPIHFPGSIQPHGMLLVLSGPAMTIAHASATVGDALGWSMGDVLNQPLSRVMGADVTKTLSADLERLPKQSRPVLLRTLSMSTATGQRRFYAIAHLTDAGTLLELENAPDIDAFSDVHAHVDTFTLHVEGTETISEMSRLASEEVRRLTEFDRVLIYQFDPNWNGIVVGEAGNGRLPALLDHRFPSSDIPAQARELYRSNRIRIIPDAHYTPSPILPALNPVTKQPLDLTFSVLRSVSPIHVEYMKNMGTASSMSVSILRDGKLWGLIACHNREPKTVPFPVRVTCDLFARAFSLRLSAIEHNSTYGRRIEVQSAYGRLLTRIANRGDFAAALAEHHQELLALTASSGAALLTEGRCLLVGETPTEQQCRDLADWLRTRATPEVFHTESLVEDYEPAHAFADKAAGVLAIGVSRIHASYVIWFRPEYVRTLRWGGDPRKQIERLGTQHRLHPRKSFETWLETVRGKSLPWSELEIGGARDLRNAIVDIVLKKAEELAELTAELKRSNQELESFSYSVSHDLRAPLRHIVGYAEILRDSRGVELSGDEERCITNIIDSSEYAGKLVDKLLSYSRLGRAELQTTRIDLNVLFEEVRRDVMRDAVGRKVTWTIRPLPTVTADLMMLRMAIRDLASNAVKYTRGRSEAQIEVGSRTEPNSDVVWITDNGVGFDMKYADKLFGVFQRLHRWEDFEGTGIGLANVRRVIERHGGETWAEGTVDRGATFYFRLPKRT